MKIAIPYTLSIGVTGHRKLADPSAVENEVTRVLQHIDAVLRDASTEPRGQCGTCDPLSRRCNRWLIHALSVFWRDIPISDKAPSAVGPNGVGKSMIAQNIAHHAVMQGHSALFINAAQMLSTDWFITQRSS